MASPNCSGPVPSPCSRGVSLIGIVRLPRDHGLPSVRYRILASAHGGFAEIVMINRARCACRGAEPRRGHGCVAVAGRYPAHGLHRVDPWCGDLVAGHPARLAGFQDHFPARTIFWLFGGFEDAAGHFPVPVVAAAEHWMSTSDW